MDDTVASLPVVLRRLLLAFALGCGGCAAPSSDPPPSTSATRLTFRTTAMGLCEDYPEESRSLEAARRDLDFARARGATVMRVALGWDAIEPARSHFDWSFWDGYFDLADAAGVRLIPYICYTPTWASSDKGPDAWKHPPQDVGDFERFCRAAAERYRGRVASWELWNEPDNPAYWAGTPQQFAQLIEAGARGTRAGDPAAQVVLGGLAWNLDFLQELLSEHDVARHLDVINLHDYRETWAGDGIETVRGYVNGAAHLSIELGQAEPIWMAEVGYSSYRRNGHVSDQYTATFDYEHTDSFQADQLIRATAAALSSGKIDCFAWYRVNDLPHGQEVIGDVNNRHLGLRDPSGRAKPAAAAFERMARWFSRPYAPIRDRVRVTTPADSDAVVHAFGRDDGAVLVIAWLATVDDDGQPPPPRDGTDRREERIALILPAAGRVTRGIEPKELPIRGVAGRTRIDGLNLRGGETLVLEVTPLKGKPRR